MGSTVYDPYNYISYVELNKRKRGDYERDPSERIENRTQKPAVKRIYLKRNGDTANKPRLYVWRQWKIPTLGQMLEEAGPFMGMPEAKFLYQADGHRIGEEDEIQEYGTYYLTGDETFHRPYDMERFDDERDDDYGAYEQRDSRVRKSNVITAHSEPVRERDREYANTAGNQTWRSGITYRTDNPLPYQSIQPSTALPQVVYPEHAPQQMPYPLQYPYPYPPPPIHLPPQTTYNSRPYTQMEPPPNYGNHPQESRRNSRMYTSQTNFPQIPRNYPQFNEQQYQMMKPTTSKSYPELRTTANVENPESRFTYPSAYSRGDRIEERVSRGRSQTVRENINRARPKKKSSQNDPLPKFTAVEQYEKAYRALSSPENIQLAPSKSKPKRKMKQRKDYDYNGRPGRTQTQHSAPVQQSRSDGSRHPRRRSIGDVQPGLTGLGISDFDDEEAMMKDKIAMDRHRERNLSYTRSTSSHIYNRRDQTHPNAYIIYVFLNGSGMESQHIQFQKKQLEKGMNYVLELVARRYNVNPAKLCNMDGKKMRQVSDLMSREPLGAYVLVPVGQSFRDTWYFLPDNAIDTSADVNKVRERSAQRDRLLQRREKMEQKKKKVNARSKSQEYRR